MTTPDLTTLRAALAPALAGQLWQQLQAAGSGLSAAQLGVACRESQAAVAEQLQAMQTAGLLQQQAGVFAANPAAQALLAATAPQPVRAGLLIGRKNIEAVVSRDRKRRS
ncbi:hypothetical protein PQU95_16355 [Vogesella sp. DC21W]|uniref:Uncharacterized protein n=1 Tax=Vogesella aquatica TaxID=2984206 RepID=A0ABT5J334_9NEIS|nr:hypothetical protein [Vogesella aquatica]MDC7718773.1 hypothetical protein [Vogesella aquatica]